jgi:hypothetical protein
MAFSIGHISGCHLNPAVSVGLMVGGRFKASELVPYVIAQVLGAVAGAWILSIIAGGQEGFGVLEGVRVREAAGVSDHFEVGAQGGDPRCIRAAGRTQA